MKKLSILLCATLLISGIAQGHTYNEEATAQLLELLSSPRRESNQEAIESMNQFITLIEHGANPNIISPDGRDKTLLTSLVIFDFFGIIANQLTKQEIDEFIAIAHRAIKVLLDHGANPNGRNDGGSTALFAVYSPEIARLLIDYGADRSIEDDRGQTALQILEAQKVSILADIAQGRSGGWLFNFSKDTQLDLIAHLEPVIEVIKTYQIN